MVMRLSGFSNSGIDIDDTVKKLMAAAKIPQDKLKQQKQTLEWQRDAYRDINSKIMSFRDLSFNMKLQSSYQTKKATSSDDISVNVTGSATSTQGNYTIKVDQLATSGSVTSGALSATSKGTDTLLSTLGLNGTTTLTVGGAKGTKTIEVKPTDTLGSLISSINGASNSTGVNLSYDTSMDKLFFTSSTTGLTGKVNLSMNSVVDPLVPANNTDDPLGTILKISGTVANVVKTDGGSTTGTNTFTGLTQVIDSTLTSTKTVRVKVGSTIADFSIDKTTTVSKLIDSINSSDIGKLGVSAYLDSNKHLVFASNPSQSITVTDEKDNVANVIPQLKMGAPVTGQGYTSFQDVGKQAVVWYNDAKGTYDTNSFSVNGLNVTAKKVTAGKVDINVTGDTDAIYNSIKNYVDKYNELIDVINTKTTEKRYRDFTPLTDDQRANMKDDQITSWETKAKSGMLRSDDILNSALQNFRSAFANPVSGIPSGDAKSLADIGISNSVVSGGLISGSYLDNGHIYIDDTKLKKAIAEKPDQVMALFVTDDKSKDSTSGDGIATRLNTLASAVISKITTKAGVSNSIDSSFTLGKTSKDLDKRIDDWTTKLDDLQTRYYSQFTAMEKYMNQMQAQSAQLTQQMGG